MGTSVLSLTTSKQRNSKMISSRIAIALILAASVQANPLNFPGRNEAEPNRRVPNPCMTMDNTVCVFPFKYNNVEYYQCTYASSPTPWCATKVDANGTVVTNNWGDCANTQTSACPVEDLTKPSCTAISGESCVFPFRYQGIVYNKCADVSITGIANNQAWCATEVTSGGEYIDGKVAVCPNTCSGAESNTATATTTTPTTTTTTTTTTTPTTTTTATSSSSSSSS